MTKEQIKNQIAEVTIAVRHGFQHLLLLDGLPVSIGEKIIKFTAYGVYVDVFVNNAEDAEAVCLHFNSDRSSWKKEVGILVETCRFEVNRCVDMTVLYCGKGMVIQ